MSTRRERGAGRPTNRRVAKGLERAAGRLDRQGANPYRAGAYRHAARCVADLPVEVRDMARSGGAESLLAIPHVDRRIAEEIMALVGSAARARLGTVGRRGRASAGPAASELLDIDREYRLKARLRRLPEVQLNTGVDAMVFPGRGWTAPVLHGQRGRWYFTAHYDGPPDTVARGSVVVYYYDGSGGRGRALVTTQKRGPQRGRRVLRSCDDAEYEMDVDGPRFPPSMPTPSPDIHDASGP